MPMAEQLPVPPDASARKVIVTGWTTACVALLLTVWMAGLGQLTAERHQLTDELLQE